MDVTRRAALAALALCDLPQTAHAQDSLSYASGGITIAVERYGAAGAGRRPAVVLLHGSDGPGPRYRTAAHLLASAGYHVFLVHILIGRASPAPMCPPSAAICRRGPRPLGTG